MDVLNEDDANSDPRRCVRDISVAEEPDRLSQHEPAARLHNEAEAIAPATGRRQSLGHLLLWVGAGLLVLNAMEAVGSLPGMPRIWTSNRNAWWLLGTVMTLTGLFFSLPSQSDAAGKNDEQD